MRTTPARLNEVIKGRIDKGAVDRLVKMLVALGKQISLTINDAIGGTKQTGHAGSAPGAKAG